MYENAKFQLHAYVAASSFIYNCYYQHRYVPQGVYKVFEGFENFYGEKQFLSFGGFSTVYNEDTLEVLFLYCLATYVHRLPLKYV